MIIPSKKFEQPKGKQNKGKQSTSTTPAGQYPNRVNLQNKHNICYASAVVQAISSVPALRALVSDVSSFPFNNATGRGDLFVKPNDPKWAKRGISLKRLSNVCALLEPADKQLPAEVVIKLMEAMYDIDAHFKMGEEDDPSFLFCTITDILNDAGDRSAPNVQGETPTRRKQQGPHQQPVDHQ